MSATVPREVFDATRQEVLTFIGNRLSSVASYFGPGDFPDDGGVTFRNEFFGYSYGWFDSAKLYMYEEPNDEWAVASAERILHLCPEHVTRVVGACHFFFELWSFHRAIWQRQTTGPSQGYGDLLKKTLDWLTNTYNPSGDYAEAWFQLVTRTSDGDEYYARAQELTYREISYAVMEDPNVVDRNWSSFAIAAGLVRQPANDPNWQRVCRDFFGW